MSQPTKPKSRQTIAETFFQHAKLDKKTGCWVWQRALQGKEVAKGGGYPSLKVNGKVVPGHRYAWYLWHGRKVPKHLQILHQCHNTKCVNPSHMRLGKNERNQREAAEAGRRAKKLTEGAVRSIRRYGSGSVATLAAFWEVSKSTIQDVLAGRTWKHI